jgi:hypothetical protein
MKVVPLSFADFGGPTETKKPYTVVALGRPCGTCDFGWAAYDGFVCRIQGFFWVRQKFFVNNCLLLCRSKILPASQDTRGGGQRAQACINIRQQGKVLWKQAHQNKDCDRFCALS